MEPQEQDKAALISDIESDARGEAEAILKEAEAQVADKKRYAQQQRESILSEARLKAGEQAEAIRKKAIWAAQREVKRRALRQRAAVLQDVLDRVEKRLAAMIGEAGYRASLVNWIAEAAVGLGADRAEVNASEKERALIDDRLLSEAGEKARAATGGQVALGLSASPPLPAQGVVLTAADGRTAFNNQVRTRMLRSRRKMQVLIHDGLFVDE
ncbi:MAG: V-type ATP synthase subunit E family protein [Phycisphaerales bacterium]